MKKRIEIIQKKIDNMYYCDSILFDLYSKYCGDEIYVLIENNEKTTWKLSFLGIEIFSYRYGDGLGWRSHKKNNGIDITLPHRQVGYTRVRDMEVRELMGYAAQSIKVSESEEVENCYKVAFDFSLLAGHVVCREIEVEEVSNDLLKDLFWRTHKWEGWEESYFAKWLL